MRALLPTIGERGCDCWLPLIVIRACDGSVGIDESDEELAAIAVCAAITRASVGLCVDSGVAGACFARIRRRAHVDGDAPGLVGDRPRVSESDAGCMLSPYGSAEACKGVVGSDVITGSATGGDAMEMSDVGLLARRLW